MTQHPQQICILGGGFGGLYTALRLSQLPWLAPAPTITLVDQNDHFLFTPLLYELVTGELQTWEIAPPFAELLVNTNIHFVQGKVEKIDLKQRLITLDHNRSHSYDRLVLALGGETPQLQVPGAAENTLPFRTVADAQQLEQRLRKLEHSDTDRIRIAVVGGGPSGVELACKLADRLGDRGRLRLIERGDQILKGADTYNREIAQRALEDRQVWLDLNTQVTKVEPQHIVLDYKHQMDTIPTELVLWTVGTAIASSIQELGLSQTEQGRLHTEPTLQLIDHPDLFALGDLADGRDASGETVPGTAQAALQQADYVAWNVWASLGDRAQLPFRYTHLGEMLTLGKDTAVLAGFGVELDGPLAYLARRLIYLYRMPTFEHQLKVGLNWVLKPVASLLSTRIL